MNITVRLHSLPFGYKAGLFSLSHSDSEGLLYEQSKSYKKRRRWGTYFLDRLALEA